MHQILTLERIGLSPVFDYDDMLAPGPLISLSLPFSGSEEKRKVSILKGLFSNKLFLGIISGIPEFKSFK